MIAHIEIKEKVTYKYLEKLYKKAEELTMQECLLINKKYFNYLKENFNKYSKNKIGSINDIYELGNPENLLVKNFIKDEIKIIIDDIFMDLVNLNLNEIKNLNNIYIIYDDKKIFLISSSSKYASLSRTNCAFKLDLLQKFILNN